MTRVIRNKPQATRVCNKFFYANGCEESRTGDTYPDLPEGKAWQEMHQRVLTVHPPITETTYREVDDPDAV